eukprot:6220958-Pyramimonas_sp.AAC.1
MPEQVWNPMLHQRSSTPPRPFSARPFSARPWSARARRSAPPRPRSANTGLTSGPPTSGPAASTCLARRVDALSASIVIQSTSGHVGTPRKGETNRTGKRRAPPRER